MGNKVYYGEYSLKHWLDLILSKNLLLPKYQRYFVWDEPKVSTLINSFRKEHFIPPVTIGSFRDESGENVNLIIDGQQRLTSILLAYLGIFPDKERFKKSSDNIELYDSTIDENDDPDDRIDNILEWRFAVLQEKGKTKEQIITKIGKEYKELSLQLEDDFFDKHYLGFCYLVPDNNDQKAHQKYYASVFKEINIQGKPLLPQESRASLYYLVEDLQPFFDPEFTKEYKLTINGNPSKADFIRYLSLLSEYKYCNDIKKVARGQKSQMEKYYEEYIYSVISCCSEQNEESEKEHSKFGDSLPLIENNNHIIRMSALKNYLSTLLADNKEFKSIIDLDMYLFGAIYYILLDGCSINYDKNYEIRNEIENCINDMKNDERHSRSPNGLTHLRKRISRSIEIYGEYLNEPKY
ncbi:MAG: DUF262 domain-containing protein [Pasteurellaceae bacterium]|nr:DUF262 domain-containing protein [Pasteurellaceae bacterium]